MLTADDIRRLAGQLENERVERKRSCSNARKVRNIACAFANDITNTGEPGYLLFGVEDDGEICGMADLDQRMQDISGLIRDNGHVLPLPELEVYAVEMDGGKHVIVAEVKPHQQPPVRAEGRIFIRIGSRLALATPSEERVLMERRSHNYRAWDEWLANGAKIDDLQMGYIREDYVPRRIAPEVLEHDERSDVDLLDTLRLWYRGIEVDGPTHGAVLLFSHRPRHFYKGLWTQFVRFDGTSRADKVLDHQEYDGDIFAQLACLEKIEEHLRTVTLEDGREVPEYPAEAIREVVINAIMHRDYSQRSPTQFYWFDDRIEVLNTGGLMAGVSPEIFSRKGPPPGWRGRRTGYRNEAISEAMKAYEFVHKFGTGIPKVRRLMAANGNPYAEYRWNATEFQVKLYSVTQPKFESDDEKIAWLLQKEGNEEFLPLLDRIDRIRREEMREKVRRLKQETEANSRQRTRNFLYAALETRGLDASDTVRRRVDDCSDIAQLDKWLLRAITAATAEEAVEIESVAGEPMDSTSS